jgi:hypothetical protein
MKLPFFTLIVFYKVARRDIFLLFWDKINKDNVNNNMWLKKKNKDIK